MKLGIMQPYFFPYLGYFSLIKYTDKWIVFDTVQYIERGWINRNRIINPNKPEDMYINIPLENHHRDILIKDVLISSNENYKDKILAQLWSSYRKRAKYFNNIYKLVEEVLALNTKSITELNVYALKKVNDYLEIPFDYEIFSKMNLTIDEVHDSGEWALNISKALNASEYVNPPGGIELFNREKFKQNNIDLKFLKINLRPYNQKKAKFIEGLSIIDVMMFNDIKTINKMLEDYTIIC